jgi:acetolactate synthase-1/2/3 large subunit
VVATAKQAQEPAQQRAADRIVDLLEAEGITTFFGVPGGAIAPIYDALVDRRSRVVHVRHETSALFMALGHHRMRPDSIPCVLTTSGPGVTNAVTGLASAHASRVPVVVLAGEVPCAKFGRGALQEGSADAIDIVAMVRKVTRFAERVTSADRAVHQLRTAIERARLERGPVLLALPFDLSLATAHAVALPRGDRRLAPPDPTTLRQAARALERAERPLVLLGGDARPAAAEIRALVRRLGLPVITSPTAKGIVPESWPACLGVFGYGGHPSARRFLEAQRPDLVLAIGCELDEVSTNSWSPLLQGDVMIQIDDDPSRFGRNYRIDIAIEGDCGVAVEQLDTLLAARGPWCHELRGIEYTQPRDADTDRMPLHPARVIRVLQEELPATAAFAVDIGEHLLYALHYLHLDRADQLLGALAFGSMGSGIGAAVGAKLAAPERAVAVVCGDFGFQMYGMELATCVQERLGVVFVVMNDARMGMVEAGNMRIYGRTLDMSGPEVDFAALARAQGASGAVVRTTGELRDALRTRPEHLPIVLDCRIDRTVSFTANARFDELSNFTVKT